MGYRQLLLATCAPNEREVWESINDLIVERAETIMYEGGIQALELLKADKKTIKTLQKILKEEESFANWLQKNNLRIAKRLMKKQLEEKKKEETEESITTTATTEITLLSNSKVFQSQSMHLLGMMRQSKISIML
jgi:hypothetical protein